MIIRSRCNTHFSQESPSSSSTLFGLIPLDDLFELVVALGGVCTNWRISGRRVTTPEPARHSINWSWYMASLGKQRTFRNTTTGFPVKWRLRNKHRNFILMMHHHKDPSSASDWLKQISHATRPIKSTTQIWVVTQHQYGISALVFQTSFCRKPVAPSQNVICFLKLVHVYSTYCTINYSSPYS